MKNERIRHLKIKIVNLADEARTIRAEEGKTSGMVKWRLQEHRKTIVRDAARCNLLAYAFLRGMPYELAESPNTTKEIDWSRVKRIVKAFGGDPDLLDDWYAGKEPGTIAQERARWAAGLLACGSDAVAS